MALAGKTLPAAGKLFVLSWPLLLPPLPLMLPMLPSLFATYFVPLSVFAVCFDVAGVIVLLLCTAFSAAIARPAGFCMLADDSAADDDVVAPDASDDRLARLAVLAARLGVLTAAAPDDAADADVT